MKNTITALGVCAQLLVFATPGHADGHKTDPIELAKSNGCFECHGSVRSMVGPSFADISKRGIREKANTEDLFQTIKHGGKGKWTDMSKGVPMPPYSGSLTDKEIQSLVAWILEFQQ